MTHKLIAFLMTLSSVSLATPGDPGWTRPSTCNNLIFQWDGSVDSNPQFNYTTSTEENWRLFYSGDASVGSWESTGTLGMWAQTFVSTNSAPTSTDLNAYYVSHFNTSDSTGNCMKYKVIANDPVTDPTSSRYQMVFNPDLSNGKDEGYLRYNLMLPGDLSKTYGPGIQDWILLAEWRYTGDYSFRMGFYLCHGACAPLGVEDDFFYKVQIEEVRDGVTTYPLKDFYFTNSDNFKPGEYLEYEFHYKYNASWGKLWINIDGKELCKYTQINTRPQGITPSAFHCPKLYTSKEALLRAAEADTILFEKVNFMEIYTD